MSTPPRVASPSWPEPSRISIASLAGLITLLVVLLALPAARPAPVGAHEFARAALVPPSQPEPLAQRVMSIGLTVADMDREIEFFTQVLDFELVSDAEIAGDAWEHLQGVFGARMRVCTLRLGEESIELTEYLAPTGRPIPLDSRSNDHWFQHIAIITSDMDAAYARLRAGGVQHVSSGPQTLPAWNPDAGGIKAFYFRDPENHILEILQFPPDKGRPKWQARDALFLGIDHTAIVVSDTERSLALYRDGLGMIVAGGAENFGSEQEHLNNVCGARLRITSLQFPSDAGRAGPSIELLEYLAPSDGRPAPADTRGNDLWHWQINLGCADPRAAWSRLRHSSLRFVSPGVVSFSSNTDPYVAGLQARDPDGHALRFLQPAEWSGAAPGDNVP